MSNGAITEPIFPRPRKPIDIILKLPNILFSRAHMQLNRAMCWRLQRP